MRRFSAFLLACILAVFLVVPVSASDVSGSRVTYDQWAQGVLGSSGSVLVPLPSGNGGSGSSVGTVVPHLDDSGSSLLFPIDFVQMQFVSRTDTPEDLGKNLIARQVLAFNSPTFFASNSGLDSKVSGMTGPLSSVNVTSGSWSDAGLRNILPVSGDVSSVSSGSSYGGYNWPAGVVSFSFPSYRYSSFPEEVYLYFEFEVEDSIPDFFAVGRIQFGNNQTTTSWTPSIATILSSGSGIYLVKDPSHDVDLDMMNSLFFSPYAGNGFLSTVNMSGLSTSGQWAGGNSLSGAVNLLHAQIPGPGKYALIQKLVGVSSANFPTSSTSSPFFQASMMALDASNGEYNWSNPGVPSGTVSPSTIGLGPSVGYSLVLPDGSLFSGTLERGNTIYNPFTSSWVIYSSKEQLAQNSVAYTVNMPLPSGITVPGRLIYTWNEYGLEVYDELNNQRVVLPYWQSSELKDLVNNTDKIQSDANAAGAGLSGLFGGFFGNIFQDITGFLSSLLEGLQLVISTLESVLFTILRLPELGLSLFKDIFSLFPPEFMALFSAVFTVSMLVAFFRIFKN